MARLADAFRASDGDLAQVCAVLVDSPEAFARPLQKFKTPQEYLVSAMRGMPGPSVSAMEIRRAA